MRRLLVTFSFIVIAVSLLPGISLAQDFHHGPKGGINFTKYRGDFDDPLFAGMGFDYKPGFAVGWHFIFDVNETLAVQPEVYYSRRSSEVGGHFFIPPVGNIQASLEPTLDYIEVPVLLRFKVNTDGAAQPIFFAGPSVAINTRAELATTVNGERETEDVRDDVETFDIGLVVGGGIVFGSGDLRYSLDVRYLWELRGFLKPETGGNATGDFKAGVFAVMFAIII